MATYTKHLLSASSNGQPILVTGTTSGSPTTIHQAVAGTGSLDEIWLYAYNDSGNVLALTIHWGGTAEPGNRIIIPIPSQAGRTLIVDGMLLQNGLFVTAYCPLGGSEITIDGYVNNIGP